MFEGVRPVRIRIIEPKDPAATNRSTLGNCDPVPKPKAARPTYSAAGGFVRFGACGFRFRPARPFARKVALRPGEPAREILGLTTSRLRPWTGIAYPLAVRLAAWLTEHFSLDDCLKPHSRKTGVEIRHSARSATIVPQETPNRKCNLPGYCNHGDV